MARDLLFDQGLEGIPVSPAPARLTPMMEQYRSVKKTLSEDTILFFRLGDFYEMFFEDAVRGAEILDITLTGREGGESGRIPMCGIPYHAFQGYVRTLIDHNLKVAICEQIGDPKLAKGLVERRVTRIITPATFLEEEEGARKHEYLAAVAGEEQAYAIACLDLGTGEFVVREVTGERLQSELLLLAPREIIFAKTLAADSRLTAFLKENIQPSLTVYEDWIFELEEAAGFLKDGFKLGSDSGISFSDRPLAVRASGAVLYYLRDHLHSALGHIRFPVLQRSEESMVLDRQAQRSLELVLSAGSRKNGPTLLSAIDQTLTAMGSRTLYEWVTRPLLSLEKIRARQAGVAECTAGIHTIQILRGLFKGVRDMERTLSRLNYGVANARDLENLKIFLARVPEIIEALRDFKSEVPAQSRAALNSFPELRDLIERAVVEAPPPGVRDGGLIRDGFSKDLDDLREVSRGGKNWILDFERRESERTGIKSLKVKYSHVFGYAIEVSKSNLHLVPADYIRRQTLANAERFVVPELKVWDEKISGAEDKIKALEYQLFNDVREKVLAQLAPLQAMARAIGVLDALASLAVVAVQKKWVRPELSDSAEIEIRGGRHPVVEAMLPSGQFVENDTRLDGTDHQLIVLTGPNMAGKSTYIRQTAHIVLLAQIGSFVPAVMARIGLVDRIFTRIGASDDLARGESTFMVEMLEMAHILRSATSRSLLILDEVGRGTATFDGVSIAWAICEFLAKGVIRPRTLFATHYHELTQLEDHFPSIKNYHITVKETPGGIVFLRKVVRGGADRSYGIHVARLAGIPEGVTGRAAEILKVLESESQEATAILEKTAAGAKKKPADKPAADLFRQNTALPAWAQELRGLDINGLTPMQALAKIAEWKEKLERER